MRSEVNCVDAELRMKVNFKFLLLTDQWPQLQPEMYSRITIISHFFSYLLFLLGSTQTGIGDCCVVLLLISEIRPGPEQESYIYLGRSRQKWILYLFFRVLVYSSYLYWTLLLFLSHSLLRHVWRHPIILLPMSTPHSTVNTHTLTKSSYVLRILNWKWTAVKRGLFKLSSRRIKSIGGKWRGIK